MTLQPPEQGTARRNSQRGCSWTLQAKNTKRFGVLINTDLYHEESKEGKALNEEEGEF